MVIYGIIIQIRYIKESETMKTKTKFLSFLLTVLMALAALTPLLTRRNTAHAAAQERDTMFYFTNTDIISLYTLANFEFQSVDYVTARYISSDYIIQNFEHYSASISGMADWLFSTWQSRVDGANFPYTNCNFDLIDANRCILVFSFPYGMFQENNFTKLFQYLKTQGFGIVLVSSYTEQEIQYYTTMQYVDIFVTYYPWEDEVNEIFFNTSEERPGIFKFNEENNVDSASGNYTIILKDNLCSKFDSSSNYYDSFYSSWILRYITDYIVQNGNITFLVQSGPDVYKLDVNGNRPYYIINNEEHLDEPYYAIALSPCKDGYFENLLKEIKKKQSGMLYDPFSENIPLYVLGDVVDGGDLECISFSWDKEKESQRIAGAIDDAILSGEFETV